jgi:hypothetical protein
VIEGNGVVSGGKFFKPGFCQHILVWTLSFHDRYLVQKIRILALGRGSTVITPHSCGGSGVEDCNGDFVLLVRLRNWANNSRH